MSDDSGLTFAPIPVGALVDSHCHLDFPDFDGRMDDLRQSMAAHGISHALCISVNLDGFKKVIDIAAQYSNFFATVGVHPDQLPDVPGASCSVEELVELARHRKVVGIGETGLDYHWVKGDRTWQTDRFRTHIQAARLTRKPLIIHTRDAAEDTIRIMQEEGASAVGGVMHCFTESWAVAKAALDLGFHISFSGIVTFKNATDLREVARQVPMDRMLVETDSPFLAPVPMRGKVNEPANVRFVAQLVADLKGLRLEEFATATSDNFRRLFLETTL